MPASRTIVRYLFSALTFAGWLGAAWSWLDHGYRAGVDPGFLVALAVGTTATLSLAVSVVMPDQARLYALGWHDRGRECACHAPEPTAEPERHLASV